VLAHGGDLQNLLKPQTGLPVVVLRFVIDLKLHHRGKPRLSRISYYSRLSRKHIPISNIRFTKMRQELFGAIVNRAQESRV